MAELADSKRVVNNITKLYEFRKAKIYAQAVDFAGRALNMFKREQGEQTFWTNRTNQANSRMFAKAFIDDNDIGFFMSHHMIYGIYLELANDRQNEAIRPIMLHWAPLFIKAVKEIIQGDT